MPRKAALLRVHADLGGRLRAIRTLMNLSRADMARLIEVPSIAIQRWEDGFYAPTRVAVATYARTAGLSAGLIRAGGETWEAAIATLMKAQVVERKKPAVKRGRRRATEVQPTPIEAVAVQPKARTPAEINAAWRRGTRVAGRYPVPRSENKRTPIIRPSDPVYVLPPCRTERGCPIALGWCTICQREIVNDGLDRAVQALARLTRLNMIERDEEDG